MSRAPDDAIAIPRSVGVCPECGADVYLEIEEHEVDTGIPTEAGCYFTCVAWDDTHGLQPYVDWLPWEAKVLLWVQKHIRIKETPDPRGNTIVTHMDGRSERVRVDVLRV